MSALEWVQALPDGMRTVVGAGGHPLIVVQSQQLALARLVLADRPVAILDEATAEAGGSGARVLEAAAKRALAGHTGLVVAHRLSQAAQADSVLVLEAAASGTGQPPRAVGRRWPVRPALGGLVRRPAISRPLERRLNMLIRQFCRVSMWSLLWRTCRLTRHGVECAAACGSARNRRPERR